MRSGSSKACTREYTRARGNGGDSEEDYSFISHSEDCQALVAKASGAEVWLGDTGTQRHIVRDRALFTSYTEGASELKGIGTASAIGRGDVRVEFALDGKHIPVTLRDALHVPTLDYNLISLGRLTSAGLSYEGQADHLLIRHGDCHGFPSKRPIWAPMGSLHVLQRSQTCKTRPESLKTCSEGFHPQTRSHDQHGHMKVM